MLMCDCLLLKFGMLDPKPDEQAERVKTNVPLLNADLKNVYDSLMKVVAMEQEAFNFSVLLVGQTKYT